MPSGWSQKTHFFPVNGVSSEDLAQLPAASTPAGPFQVLSAGSLIRVKGFGLAIKAFKEFNDRHPDSEFNIMGSGPERPRLQTLIQDSNLNAKVHLVPHMTRGELLEKMGSHDVFLFPSLRDGGGAVVIEAMAAGKPVICLDTGGPGMHVTDDWGFKIAPSSPEHAIHELASCLERMYLYRDLRDRLGRAAHEGAENYYHWDKLGEQLMEIYKNALAAGRDS
jgi:glycosyltransferase involved in cell wall biosynthesis